jgi:hypothetical protein
VNLPDLKLPAVSLEDAIPKVLRWLREHEANARKAFETGGTFQFAIASIVQDELMSLFRQQLDAIPSGNPRPRLDQSTNAGVYYDAAWELVRRGIFAPATTLRAEGVTEFSGREFRLLPYGERWLRCVDVPPALPSEQGRFAHLLEAHAPRLGKAYVARALEALACYQATCYLACCTMCGGAAEATLLLLADAKTANPEEVRRRYRRAKGADWLLTTLAQGKNAHLQENLAALFELLKYWRDESVHVSLLEADEGRAFLALLHLQKLARFADERWDELIA